MEYLICFTIGIAMIIMLPVILAIIALILALIIAGILVYALMGVLYVGSLNALRMMETLGVWLIEKAKTYGLLASIYIAGLHKKIFTD